MPVIIKLNYEDGTEEVLRFPAEVWRLNDVEAKKIIPTSKKVVKWTLDPYYEIADIDTDDNAFPREPAKPNKRNLTHLTEIPCRMRKKLKKQLER